MNQPQLNIPGSALNFPICMLECGGKKKKCCKKFKKKGKDYCKKCPKLKTKSF